MRQKVPGVRVWLRAMRLGRATGCHQNPHRSFFIGGYQLPLCARCTGLVLGQLLALPLLWVLPPSPFAALGILPLAADGLTQEFGGRRSNNRLRFATGLLAGWANLTFLVWAARRVARLLRR